VNDVEVVEVRIAANGTGWAGWAEAREGVVVVVDVPVGSAGAGEVPFEVGFSDGGEFEFESCFSLVLVRSFACVLVVWV
jgi:hypothetical protein